MNLTQILLLVLSVLTLGKCSEDLNNIGQSTVAFAANVYQKLAPSSGNLLISPISIQTVLALVETAANGTTLEEMSKALNLPADKNQLKESFGKLGSSLRNVRDITLDSANKIYVRNDIKVSKSFQKSAEIFDAEIENINLSKKKEAIMNMNSWVENKTNHKIKDIIKEDDINADTAIILINALYFNAGWQYPFNENKTTQEDFYLDENTTVKVDMMHDKFVFYRYFNQELDATFLDMTYKDPDFVLTIILPWRIDGLAHLEKNIEKVLQVRSDNEFDEDLIEVWLPKFTMAGSIDCKEVLKELGVKKLFEDADLSGMTADKRSLTVAKVIQKTFIDVNEKGTEAGATTVVFAEDRIAGGTLTFVANHPFLFVLRQRSTGVIQFLGRYTGP